MILPFSTQINGKPTYFVESIWEGLMRYIFEEDKEYQEYFDQYSYPMLSQEKRDALFLEKLRKTKQRFFEPI